MNNLENIQIDIDGIDYKITSEVTRQTIILKNPTTDMASAWVYSNHFNKLLSMEATTFIPQEKNYKKQKF